MTEDTIIQIGKAGITENTVTEVNNALAARELIKGRVLENSLLDDVALHFGGGKAAERMRFVAKGISELEGRLY